MDTSRVITSIADFHDIKRKLNNKGETVLGGKGEYLARVSVQKKWVMGEYRLKIVPNDKGAFDANKAAALHAVLLKLEKAGRGKYVQSPKDPNRRGTVPVLMNGPGCTPYLSMQQEGSGSRVDMEHPPEMLA